MSQRIKITKEDFLLYLHPSLDPDMIKPNILTITILELKRSYPFNTLKWSYNKIDYSIEYLNGSYFQKWIDQILARGEKNHNFTE